MQRPSPSHPISQPWLISEEGLRLVLGVWSRGDLFGPELAARREAWLAEGGGRRSGRGLVMHDGIAVIPVCGPIFSHAGMMTDLSGATSYTAIGRDLAAALADPAVGGVVLQFSSPGGEAAGVAELAEQIRLASQKKPVVAHALGSCCSAAYWLAAACPLIVACETAELGSVGCRIVTMDDSGAQEKAGLREVEIVSSQSPHKRGTPLDEAVVARIQARADALAQVFVDSLARLRAGSAEKVLADYGQGDVMIASAAVAAGVADRIGSLEAALGAAREMSMNGTQPGSPAASAAGAPNASSSSGEEAQLALAAQLRALTGTDDPEQQQIALAQLGVKASLADRLQSAVGDERTALLAKARGKGIPPIAMAGWEHLSLPALREVVEKSKGIRAHAPSREEPPVLEDTKGAEASGGEPRGATVSLTDADRRQFSALGVTDEAEMRRRKASMSKGTTAKAFANGAKEE